MSESKPESRDVELRKLHRNDYNPRFARARHGGDADIDVGSLVESIDKHGLASPLSVRENDDGYEVIAGERRLLALRECFDDNHEVPVTVHNVDREGAMQLAYEENEEREDLSPMDEAWHFAERVRSDFNGKSVTYAEYVGKLHNSMSGNQGPLADLDFIHSPSKKNTDVKEVAEASNRSASNVSEYLSFLLLPAEARQWVDDGDLTKRAAREIISRCRSNIDDPCDALDMIAGLAEEWSRHDPNEGLSQDDYGRMIDDIKTRIEDYNRRQKIAKEQVTEYANLFTDRLGNLSDKLDNAARQFHTPYPVPEVPSDAESPDDVNNLCAILDGVERYREVLKSHRAELHEKGDDLADERDNLETERARLNQTVRHFDSDDGECPFCQQDLAIEPVQDRLSDVTERLDEIRKTRNAINEESSDVSDARSSLHHAKKNVEKARDSYEDAYETAMELNGGAA